MNRREFLGLSGLGFLTIAGTTGCGKVIRSILETATPQSGDLLDYYREQGITFQYEVIETSRMSIAVLNGSDLNVDGAAMQELYEFYENIDRRPIEYALTADSGTSLLVPRTAPWISENNKVVIVPRKLGVPPEMAGYAGHEAVTFASPDKEGFTTFIRVPDESEMSILAPSGDLTRLEWVHVSTVIEACQGSIFVDVQKPFGGVALPLPEQRILAQEGYCNAFNIGIRGLQDKKSYSPELFAYAFPFQWADGNVYNVNSVILTSEEYNSIPITSYLQQP